MRETGPVGCTARAGVSRVVCPQSRRLQHHEFGTDGAAPRCRRQEQPPGAPHRAAGGVMARIEFEAADRARRALLASHRLSSREAYVLRLAPIHGLSQTMSRRRRGERIESRIGTIWLVRDENLTTLVEALLARGFLALRRGAGPPCAELTAEGRAALEAGQMKPQQPA